MNLTTTEIYADALRDTISDIVEPISRLIDSLGRQQKAIKLTDNDLKAFVKLYTDQGVQYLDDTTAPIDIDGIADVVTRDLFSRLKGTNKLTVEQKELFETLIRQGAVTLGKRILQVRKQLGVASGQAKEFISEALHRAPTNWDMPAEYAFEAAQEIDETLDPTLALIKASTYIQRLRRRNRSEQTKLVKARETRNKLRAEPITNAGPRGIKGLIQRWLLASLNATPFDNFNWIEVNQDGLQIYTPFATVSQRTIRPQQIIDGSIVLSVNPPAYLDPILGFLRQFRRNIQVPLGEIVVYEQGSGRTVARAIALHPDKKIKEMRAALEFLHLLENPYRRHQRLPRLRDILIYYDFAGSSWEEMEQLFTADLSDDPLSPDATSP
ncbi:MAG: hypothetical protein R2867_20020 [Caldilineaceae bacterium]